jgi:hypothetical protein
VADQRKPQSQFSRPPSKSPAERSVEYDAKQAKLREDAARRREAAKADAEASSEPSS